MKFSGSVSLRPVRIGFLVPPDDLAAVVRAARLTACLWGGRYNPIIPFFEGGGDRWRLPYSNANGLDIARGYVEFFEPDVLVETVPGMAEKLGWQSDSPHFGMPRVLPLDEFYEMDSRGKLQFSTGIDIYDVIHDLYHNEFKFERRHKQTFTEIEAVEGDAFFDVVCGRYPNDEVLQYIPRAYRDVFAPEILKPDITTALRHLTDGLFGPIGITGYELTESLSNGRRDHTFYVFDPTNASDVIDYWNFRLIESHATPINVNWFGAYETLLRERIHAFHRPIPGNPFGTMFHSTICFTSSIHEEKRNELISSHLSGLPEMAFFLGYNPTVWRQSSRNTGPNETKIRATGKAISFDEEASSDNYIKVPSPSPSFLNRSQRYSKAHWINVIVPGEIFGDDVAATVYPTNLWSPTYPRVVTGDRSRIGREGWIVQLEHSIGYTLVNVQTGREAIIGWLKTQGIDAKPSEEGQIAAQVIAAAGGLLASGMFADKATLELLGEMAESHSQVSRNGRLVVKSLPDRAKHVNTVQHHFEARKKRSFGYWNSLEYFLKRSVFRAGLRVQCPVCAFQNWLDLDAISYRPTCTRCLNDFEFSQSPNHLKDVKWFYRVIGPFAAPDFARGGYCVALTLRTLADRHDTEITWSTGLSLEQLNCEIDFVAWHRGRQILSDERDEPLLVIGEAKSFGRNAINDEAVAALQKVAERFPGGVMVISTLRDIGDLTLGEIGRLRRLALWGRRATQKGEPINPLILLTGTELFAEYDISNAWKQLDGNEMHPSYDFRNLHTLADLTQKRYLGLAPYWDRQAGSHAPDTMRAILGFLRRPGDAGTGI